MSVAFAPELWEEVRTAAERTGTSWDDWFAEAVETKLRAEDGAASLEAAARSRRHLALGEYLDQWEAEHGAFTDEELSPEGQRCGVGAAKSR